MADTSTPWILAMLLFLLVIIALYVNLRHWFAEGFVSAPLTPNPTVLATPAPNTTPIQKTVTYCPPGSKYFVNKRGDSMCCEGEIENRKCRGKIVCTLSQSTSKHPSCATIIQNLQSQMAVAYCPPSMPNFYVNEVTGEKGCTASGLTTIGDGPVHTAAPRCIIASSTQKNLADITSCLNQKRLEEMTCIAPNCTKGFHTYAEGKPIVLTQSFVVPDGESIPRQCINEHSMEIYLDATEPNWRSSGKPEYNFATDIRYCTTAKKSLIERQYVDIPGQLP